MILSVEATAQVDGTDVRESIALGEIFLLADNTVKKVSSMRRNASKIAEFKKLVDSSPDKTKLAAALVSSGRIVDALGGMFYTMNDCYTYLQDNTLEASQLGISDAEFTELKKVGNAVNSLYNSMLLFKTQIIDSSAYDKTALNVDDTLTDSEGKSTNIVNTLVESEEDVVDVSDTTIKNNFKIYLDYLYESVCAIKGIQKEQINLQSFVYNLLSFMWVDDTLNSVRTDQLSVSSRRVLPIVRKNARGKLETTISKVQRKDFLGYALTFVDMYKCIKLVCRKMFIKHRSQIGDVDMEMETNVYAFTRCIYRIYQILGIKLFDPQEVYTFNEVYDRILNPDNPEALCNLIPAYKYMPNFYNKVNTLQEWYEIDDLSDEYHLEYYGKVLEASLKKTGLRAPAFDLLNTTSAMRYPETLQSIPGSELNEEEEIKQLLQLNHLIKLLGTTNNGENLYRSLYEKKLHRVILLERPVTINTIKSNKTCLVSAAVEEEINRPRNEIIYKVKGMETNIFQLREEAQSNISYVESTLGETDPEVKEFIDACIEQRIQEIADIYLNYYYVNNWNFPFVENRKDLVQKISNTKRITYIYNRSYFLLLGDYISIQAKPYARYEDVKTEFSDYVLTADYYLIKGETIKKPKLGVEEQIVDKAQLNYMLRNNANLDYTQISENEYSITKYTLCV